MTPTPRRDTPSLFIEGAGRRPLISLINSVTTDTDYDLATLIFSPADYEILVQAFEDVVWDGELQTDRWSVRIYSTDDPEASNVCATDGVPVAILTKGDERIQAPFAYAFLNRGWKFDDLWEFFIQLSEITDRTERLQHFYKRGLKMFRRQRGKPTSYWASLSRNGITATAHTAIGFRKPQSECAP